MRLGQPGSCETSMLLCIQCKPRTTKCWDLPPLFSSPPLLPGCGPGSHPTDRSSPSSPPRLWPRLTSPSSRRRPGARNGCGNSLGPRQQYRYERRAATPSHAQCVVAANAPKHRHGASAATAAAANRDIQSARDAGQGMGKTVSECPFPYPEMQKGRTVSRGGQVRGKDGVRVFFHFPDAGVCPAVH